jgi:hypothetical protein
MKTSKFLLCENPIADQSDGRQFILHTRPPRLLAEIFAFEKISDEKIMEIQRQITTGSRLDYGPETFVFGLLWIFESDFKEEMSSQQRANEVAGIMRRMADWYEAYLIWEDSQDHDFTEENL